MQMHTLCHTQASTKNRAVSFAFQRFKRPNPSSVDLRPKGTWPHIPGGAWSQRGNGFRHPGSQSQPSSRDSGSPAVIPFPTGAKRPQKALQAYRGHGRRTRPTATDPGLRSAEAQRPNTSALHYPCNTDTSPKKWDSMLTPWQNGTAR